MTIRPPAAVQEPDNLTLVRSNMALLASAPEGVLACQLLSLECRTANMPNHVGAGEGVAVGAPPGRARAKRTTGLSTALKQPA